MTRTKIKTSSSLFQDESFPIKKRPFFAGSDYQFWKNKMTWYLQYLDLEVWKTIVFGYTFTKKMLMEVKSKNLLNNIVMKKIKNFN